MDTEGPFTDFFDSTAKLAVEPEAAPKAEAKKERKKRTPRKQPAAEPVAIASPPETPDAPKRRGPKPGARRQPGAGSKVDLGVAIEALAGLPPEDAKIVARLANGLQQLSKKARTRIVAALGCLFA